MKNPFKKRGQSLKTRFSRFSHTAREESKEHLKSNFLQRFSHIKNIRLLILEWVLLVTALILLAVSQAFWFQDSYSNDVFVSGDNFTEATIGKVNSMNPLFATTNSEKVLSRLLFATLSAVDYSGHFGLDLASSLTPSEEGKTWTLKLKDGLVWSDGQPITVADVIFTTNLIKSPAVDSIYRSNLLNVKVSAGENDTVIFTLPAPYADFITALNFPLLPEHILRDADKKSLIEHGFSVQPITSGPFTFNATQLISPAGEKVIHLSANRNYHKGRPLLDSFTVHAFLDKAQIISALNAGTVTATAELTSADQNAITTKLIYEKKSALNSGVFIFFNTTKAPLSQLSLRTAIREGIDLAELRAQAPNTNAIDYPLLSSQIELSNYPAIPTINQEQAIATVKQVAGDQPLTLELATVSLGYLPDLANSLKTMLERLGFTVNLTIHEENQDFTTNIISRRNYDILIYPIELGADSDLLPYYHSSQASTSGLNLSNYQNPLVDDLLLGARQTLNHSLRVKKYETFLRYWVADIPAIGVYQPNLSYFYHKNVRALSDYLRLSSATDRFSNVNTWAVTKMTRNRTP